MNLLKLSEVLKLLPISLQALVFALLLMLLMAKRQKKWSACGAWAPNGSDRCGRREGHDGQHSWQVVDIISKAESDDFELPRTLHGEVGAIAKQHEAEPAVAALKMTAYLRNRAGHAEAKEELEQWERKRALKKLNMDFSRFQ